MNPESRVVYRNNGRKGTAKETGVGDEKEFTRVLFDGHQEPRLVKTAYLDPVTDDGPPPVVRALDPLDELEREVPVAEFSADHVPLLLRSLVLATIHQARQIQRLEATVRMIGGVGSTLR